MKSKQIFLIEDDEDDQEIFLAAVDEIGNALVCKTAFNGHDAYSQLLNKKVNPDLIFLDLNMPLMNGQQFLEKIRKDDHLKNIPVIILTTSSNPDTVAEVKQLGAQDFITKPGSFTELTGLLQTAITNFL
jgi:CheY-like chemotaxis protein